MFWNEVGFSPTILLVGKVLVGGERGMSMSSSFHINHLRASVSIRRSSESQLCTELS